MNIVKSVARYDSWLRKQLNNEFVKKDLKKKHKKMAADPFQFLRATYWRWAETILDICPGLGEGPDVLAVGDIHLENFGTWSDAEGRLIWGVNDFDEAARMPYAIDIVRLAASAVLANVRGISEQEICASILQGYREGVSDPKPFVLDREHPILRDKFVVTQDERTKFWAKFDPAEIRKTPPKNVKPITEKKLPLRHAKALRHARPDKSVAFGYYARTAGTGSLGRPRFFGTGVWQGDLIVREAKAMLRSGWTLAHGGARSLRCLEIASGEYRSPDPTYRLRDDVLVRRLSPNDFKIEAAEKEKSGKAVKAAEQENPTPVKRSDLVDADVLHAMGRDIAAIHRGTNDGKGAGADLKRRQAGWLEKAVAAATKAVQADFKEWKAHHDAQHDDGG